MSDSQTQAIIAITKNYITIIKRLQRTVAPRWLHMDITMAQIRVLFVLLHRGPAKISTVAESLNIGLPTASHLVDRLVKANLARRFEDSRDRRQTMAQLTTQGSELLEQFQQDRQEQLGNWIAQMDPADFAALQQGLQALEKISRQSLSAAELQSPDINYQG